MTIAALIALLLALLGVAIFVSARINDSSRNKFVADAIPVSSAVQDLVLQMVNMETAVRGYIITGNPNTLGPYGRGRRAAAADLAALRPHLGKHPRLAKLVARARRQIASIQRFFDLQVVRASQGPRGRQNAQRHVLDGKLAFDGFRHTAVAMENDTNDFIAASKRAQDRTFFRFLLVLIALGAVAVGIGLLLYWRTPRRLAQARRDAETSANRLALLAEASELLGSSLDYRQTLARLAAFAVPRLADWCSIDMADDDGRLERIAVAHQDPAKVRWAQELAERFPPDPEAPRGAMHVLRTGEPEFYPEIPAEVLADAVEREPELGAILGELGLRSAISVPLNARGRTLGVLTLVQAESGRLYTEGDLELAQELARRAAVAVDNARLFEEADRGAQAARALEYVGEAVVVVDTQGYVRFWNPAAETLFGRPAGEATDTPAAATIPGFTRILQQVPLGRQAGAARFATLPLPLPNGERWISISAVDFGEGRVYTLRDVSDEHELERLRAEFVATASHELRTPLSAVYGAARTLRRTDVELSPADQAAFLAIIESESERLAQIVNQILLAGQLEAGEVRLNVQELDLVGLTESVLASAELRKPADISFKVTAAPGLPQIACDEGKLRQVLVNLVENAIKYSPDGGEIAIDLAARNGTAVIAVSDPGLGIPPAEHERIFDRFYRLDPNLARGVGGSGLGLYIVRELVERMHGRVLVESAERVGSTFTVELPLQTD
jgi:signal transduction histidine kinase/CHASE3 domain sensor protein